MAGYLLRYCVTTSSSIFNAFTKAQEGGYDAVIQQIRSYIKSGNLTNKQYEELLSLAIKDTGRFRNELDEILCNPHISLVSLRIALGAAIMQPAPDLALKILEYGNIGEILAEDNYQDMLYYPKYPGYKEAGEVIRKYLVTELLENAMLF